MLYIESGKKNTILRKVSEKITKKELKIYAKLAKDMLKYIKDPDNWGVGLAAPQVGHNKRIIVVSLLDNWEDENYSTIVMFNPEILSHSSDKQISDEWCLSLPWETGKVLRYTTIKLKYFDKNFNEKVLNLHWLKSYIVQHEINHLDWILFTDLIEKNNILL